MFVIFFRNTKAKVPAVSTDMFRNIFDSAPPVQIQTEHGAESVTLDSAGSRAAKVAASKHRNGCGRLWQPIVGVEHVDVELHTCVCDTGVDAILAGCMPVGCPKLGQLNW